MSNATPDILGDEFLALFQDVTVSITSSLDLEQTLETIARRSAEVFDVWECNLYEYSPETDALVATAVWGSALTDDDLAWVGAVIPLAEHEGYHAIIEGRQIVEYVIDDPALPAEERAQMDEWGEKAYISVPLEFQGEVIGCLDLVERRAARHFTEYEKEALRRLAVPAAIALHNAHAYRAEQDRARRLASLADASRAITSSVVLEDVLDLVVERAAKALGSPQCMIYEYDAEQDAIISRAVYEAPGFEDPNWDDPDFEGLGTVFLLDEFPSDRAILQGREIVEERVSDDQIFEDSRESMELFGEKSCLTAPLYFGDEPLGMLVLIELEHDRHFTPDEREFVQALAEQAAIAMHNARAYRAQQDRARHLSSLADASRAITSSVVLEDVLDLVAMRAGKTLGSPQCLIYEYDAERDAIVSRAFYEAPGCEDPNYSGLGTAIPLDAAPSDRAILEARALIVENVSDEDIYEDSRESMERNGEKTCLTAPLYFGDEPLGMLLLIETEHERRFTPEELELVEALAQQAAIAIHNAHLFRRQELQNQRLVTLAEVSRAISASLDAQDVLERVCSAVGAFFFEAPTEAEVWLRSGRGYVPFRTQLAGGKATPRMPDKLVAQMIKKRVPVQNGSSGRGRRLVVPLIVNRFIEGYLDVRCRRRSHLTDDEMQVVEILVGHAAVALENAQNYGKLESMYLETVRALAAAIEAKDHYTAEHGDRLASMAIAVGRRLGLDDRALRDVQYAAVLHDIGKIGIPGAILNKPDKLTDEEFAVMAEHTIIGERIISHIDYLAPIAGMIRSAHERWDGHGYPDKLEREEIPMASRILLVCDAFHAMTSDRPYRKAMPEEDALQELRRNAGAQFDPVVVGAFLEAWPDFEGSELAAGATSRAQALVN
jgi:HD-GYP domain-containing protein (c-di-GMP phosphodiesterase class II)